MYICIYILYGGVRACVRNEITESEQMGNGKKNKMPGSEFHPADKKKKSPCIPARA